MRGVWMRPDLLSRHHWLVRPKKAVRKRKVKRPTDRCRLSSASIPSTANGTSRWAPRANLWPSTLFFAGTLNAVGKVYIQTVLGCFSRFVWGRLRTSKMPVIAVQILNNHALPFFEENGVKVETIPSDSSRE